jgi:SAM-dependent methyltransferase
LSIGCGSGLFEYFLNKNYGIEINEGIEPSQAMAKIAEKRGMSVQLGTVEETYLGIEKYETILFNGTPGYINNLDTAFKKAYQALKNNGKIVVIDVPKEGSFAMLYNLAKTIGTWNHSIFDGIKPQSVYPIEFVKEAKWRTTEEKVEILKKAGLSNYRYAQTLTTHPLYANNQIEEPVEGYERGDYIAICAIK